MQLKEKFYARTLMRKKKPMVEILKFFNGRYNECEIRAGVESLREKGRQRYARNHSGAYHNLVSPGVKPTTPPDVIAEREHRKMLLPKSITAWVMGDPLPGESALETKARAK